MLGRPALVLPQDQYGRWFPALAPAGGTLTIDTSAVPNGFQIPGEIVKAFDENVILRITAIKDHYLRFTRDGPPAATDEDIMLLEGCESMQLPIGTNYISAITIGGLAGRLSVTVTI